MSGDTMATTSAKDAWEDFNRRDIAAKLPAFSRDGRLLDQLCGLADALRAALIAHILGAEDAIHED